MRDIAEVIGLLLFSCGLTVVAAHESLTGTTPATQGDSKP